MPTKKEQQQLLELYRQQLEAQKEQMRQLKRRNELLRKQLEQEGIPPDPPEEPEEPEIKEFDISASFTDVVDIMKAEGRKAERDGNDFLLSGPDFGLSLQVGSGAEVQQFLNEYENEVNASDIVPKDTDSPRIWRVFGDLMVLERRYDQEQDLISARILINTGQLEEFRDNPKDPDNLKY